MLDHGARNRIHTTEKHGIRLFAFKCGQDGREVGGFVGGELTANDGRASSFSGFFKFISNALAVSSTVINDRDVFAFEIVHSVAAQCAT